MRHLSEIGEAFRQNPDQLLIGLPSLLHVSTETGAARASFCAENRVHFSARSARTEKPAEKGRPSVTQITVCGQARVYIRRTAPDFSWAISVIDRLGRNRGEPDAGSQLAQKLE
jgi:hypothetical protein